MMFTWKIYIDYKNKTDFQASNIPYSKLIFGICDANYPPNCPKESKRPQDIFWKNNSRVRTGHIIELTLLLKTNSNDQCQETHFQMLRNEELFYDKKINTPFVIVTFVIMRCFIKSLDHKLLVT